MVTERIIVIFFVAIALAFVLRSMAHKYGKASMGMGKGDEPKPCDGCRGCYLHASCNSNRVPTQKNS